jgi:hypothetical protein
MEWGTGEQLQDEQVEQGMEVLLLKGWGAARRTEGVED